MKTATWKWTTTALFGAAMLLGSPADAKPGKGGGKEKGGGPPAHAGGGKAKGPKGGGAPPGQAKAKGGPDKGAPDRGQASRPGPKDGRAAIAVYRDADRQRVLDYFATQREHPHGLPPGLAKKLRDGKPLPPGWQKKLEPGWVVADDWWPRFTPLPYDWFPQLPVIPDTGLYLYGDRVVRVFEPRREVIDVIVVPTIHIDL